MMKCSTATVISWTSISIMPVRRPVLTEINEATKVVKEKKVAKATNINKKEGILENVSTGKEEGGNLDVE